MCDLILLANGTSQRFGENKLLIKIGEEFLINSLLKKIIKIKEISQIILVTDIEIKNIVINDKKINVTSGGNSRQESVLSGLKLVNEKDVLIHDAARPFVEESLILEVIKELEHNDCVIPTLKIVDCLKHNGKTVNRDEFFLSQTPQGVKTDLIKKAYNSDEVFFDEGHAIEKMDKDIVIKYIKGFYGVFITETLDENIVEFRRVTGIDKNVVRTLIINTDSEMNYIQSTKYAKTDMAQYKEERPERKFGDRKNFKKFEENMNKYVKKGYKLAVEGSLNVIKNNNSSDQYSTQTIVQVSRVEFLNTIKSADNQDYSNQQQSQNKLKELNLLESIGGLPYISEVASNFYTDEDFESLLEIVYKNSVGRQLDKAILDIQKLRADNLPIDQLFLEAQQKILNIKTDFHNDSTQHIKEILKQVLKNIEEAEKNNGALTGVPSAARPSMGKTAFALNLALNAAQHNSGVAFFSLEMPNEQLAMRMLSNLSQVDSNLLRKAQNLNKDK
ncbi:hypothetical protein FQR65_LT17606 [Abscondita terminalis]|nr:hypothetical protein FQR65_LT17606 [Abscondita terminalis]